MIRLAAPPRVAATLTRLAAALAFTLAPTLGAAQSGIDHLGTEGYARAKINLTPWAEQSDSKSSSDGPGSLLNLAANVEGADALAYASATSGALRASAVSLSDTNVATARAALRTRFSLTTTNTLFEAYQPIEFYLHGGIHGEKTGTPDQSWAFASGMMSASLYRVGLWGGLEKVFDWTQYFASRGDVLGQDVQNRRVFLAPVSPFGGTSYELVWELSVMAGWGYESDFGHTARVFAPPTDGVSLASDDGFLTDQARPDWAGPQGPTTTTTPEPATLALTGAGLAAAAAARRRRRR